MIQFNQIIHLHYKTKIFALHMIYKNVSASQNFQIYDRESKISFNYG